MFRRKHHRDIALILSNLNAEWLREHDSSDQITD